MSKTEHRAISAKQKTSTDAKGSLWHLFLKDEEVSSDVVRQMIAAANGVQNVHQPNPYPSVLEPNNAQLA